MGFREQMREDLGAVFFNLSEFAEMHVINGKEVPAVIDNEKLAELYLGRDTHAEEIFTDKIMFYVPETELEFEPVPGQYLEFDGEGYLVTDVKRDGGIYTVVLEANEH